jgi:phosphatidylserine/phosphatidylglycerophosphate/cardiolipin synthase-like enzyme
MLSSTVCLWPCFVVLAGGATPSCHPILDPAFQQQLNAETNSILAVSDDIQLLVDGVQSYPVRWRMLENARQSIHFSTMYIFADKTTKRLGDLLIRKKKDGVDVKIIVYGFYSLGNLPFYARMRKSGIEIQKYSSVPDVLFHGPKRFWTRHLHDKYLVVDGQEALLGGMNWSARYERGGTKAKVAWRDTDIYVRGPQAEIIEKEFMKRWWRNTDREKLDQGSQELDTLYRGLLYPPARRYSDYLVPDPNAPFGYRGKDLTRFLYQQPFEYDGAAHMTSFYKEVIDRAQKCILWQSISIRPAPIQKRALLEAARRGVDVRLMTNSKRNMCMLPIGGWPIYYLTRAEYKDLLKGGVRIFEYSGDAPMHSKGFLVDDVVAAIGSYNATFTAERYYTESAIAIYDADAIRAVRRMLEEDFAHCTEVTLETLQHTKRHRAGQEIKKPAAALP